MTLPTFLGVGVPRAGTTWLHSLLDSHPDVYMPQRRKEIRFFDRHYQEGLGWYEEFFCSDDEAGSYRAIGEISPQYLYDDECPDRISETLPGVTLLLMLRHPVDRAYSTYGFTMQRANFRGSFAEFLESRPSVLERGFYSRYVKRYLERFERDRILPLIFEESIADVETARGKLADFLGLDASRFPPESGTTKVNRSSAPALGAASGFAVKMARRLRRRGLEPAVDVARRLGIQRILSTGTPIPPLDDRLRTELGNQYSGEFDELESMLGIDLGRWRSTAATRPA